MSYNPIHEIKTPINAISQLVESVKDDRNVSKINRNQIKIAFDISKTLLNHIDSISQSRIKGGQLHKMNNFVANLDRHYLIKHVIKIIIEMFKIPA